MKRPSLIPKWLVPKPFRAGGKLRARAAIMAHLLHDYGWLRSLKQGQCVDRDGHPIPWFTYPAIDFLSQLDFSNKTIFEYGCGASTLFWAQRAKHVTGVESESDWYQHVAKSAPPNSEIIFVSRDIEEYASTICGRGKFDVIVIDGTGESRPRCCELALEHVRDGGIVILDNSDLWLNSAAILRNSGLIQVDFTGFGPLNSHASCTSIFLTRNYNFAATKDHQPHKSVAQPSQPWSHG